VRGFVVFGSVAVGTLVAILYGCASSEEADPSRIDAAQADRVSAKPGVGAFLTDGSGGRSDAPPDGDGALPSLIDAACNARIEAPTIVTPNHVPFGTPLAFVSNPPSSGPHYPAWADFREYTQPVPDGYIVHSLEHGAVALFYKCATPAECASIVPLLRDVRANIPTDPACDPSIRVRVIIVPRPDNDVPVSAAAWGYTYKAECVDGPSLAQFVRDHYAKGPEDFCAPGLTSF